MAYNLFISHSWSYGDQYDRFVELLRRRSYFQWRNYSVSKDDPIHNAPDERALMLAIANQISPCHVVVIMAGVYATYSNWINKEVRIAQSGFTPRKPILAVEPFGSERTSAYVKKVADEIAGWNTESIVSAIRRLA